MTTAAASSNYRDGVSYDNSTYYKTNEGDHGNPPVMWATGEPLTLDEYTLGRLAWGHVKNGATSLSTAAFWMLRTLYSQETVVQVAGFGRSGRKPPEIRIDGRRFRCVGTRVEEFEG